MLRNLIFCLSDALLLADIYANLMHLKLPPLSNTNNKLINKSLTQTRGIYNLPPYQWMFAFRQVWVSDRLNHVLIDHTTFGEENSLFMLIFRH